MQGPFHVSTTRLQMNCIVHSKDQLLHRAQCTETVAISLITQLLYVVTHGRNGPICFVELLQRLYVNYHSVQHNIIIRHTVELYMAVLVTIPSPRICRITASYSPVFT